MKGEYHVRIYPESSEQSLLCPFPHWSLWSCLVWHAEDKLVEKPYGR